MNQNKADWQRVSRRRPCPVCEKPDWCLYSGPASARAVRVQAIRDAARVREHLGQAALCRHLNGSHEIIFRGKRFVGATVEEAIEVAREGGG